MFAVSMRWSVRSCALSRETLNLRNSETDLLAPRMKTSNGQKGCSFRGSKVWIELEHEVTLAPSLSTFKCRLKCK